MFDKLRVCLRFTYYFFEIIIKIFCFYRRTKCLFISTLSQYEVQLDKALYWIYSRLWEASFSTHDWTHNWNSLRRIHQIYVFNSNAKAFRIQNRCYEIQWKNGSYFLVSVCKFYVYEFGTIFKIFLYFPQELLELNPFVKFNMTMGLVVMPILQPVLIGIFAFLTVFALVKFVIAGRGILEVIQSRSLLRQDNKTLEISLECEEQEFIKK